MLDKPAIKEAASNMVRNMSLEVALTTGIPLSQALADATLVVGIKEQLSEMLNATALVFGAEASFDKPARQELLKSIAAQHGTLNVEEVALAMQYGRAGKYGKQYHKLNGAAVLYWLHEYSVSEERLGYWQREAEVSAPSEPEGIYGALGNVLAGMAPRRLSDGSVSLKPLTAAPYATALHIPPTPGSAAWHRMQADRIEAKEAAIEKQKELTNKRVIGMIEADTLQKKAKADFRRFALKNYYSLLNTSEREILRAAESGPLTNSQQIIFNTLTLAWNGVLMDWEDEQVRHILAAGDAALSNQ